MENHQKIVVNLTNHLISTHNEFCECNYCEILKKYVNLKIYKVKVRRNIDIYEDEYYFSREYLSIMMPKYNSFSDLESAVNKLKFEKDNLKMEAML